MFDFLSTYHFIIIFSSLIIISYFFNSFSKKSGVPSVLMLIFLGIIIGFSIPFQEKFSVVLEVLGTVGLILIVLDGSLGLKVVKKNISVIIRSFFVSLITLLATSYFSSLFLNYFFNVDFTSSLLITVPLSILSSAILLPSIDSLEVDKREFLIYESTFSDIIGIIVFYSLLNLLENPGTNNTSLGSIFSNVVGTSLFSIIISYFLIYVFQKLQGQAKLFLLISVLMFLYGFSEMLNFSSLIIILIFGLILNNYNFFFKGVFFYLIDDDKKISEIVNDFKTITLESAFVVRTFFFILFGWSIKMIDLISFKSLFVGSIIVFVIFLVRSITLFSFSRSLSVSKITPELFLAPRGLLTILLFYQIPEHLIVSNLNFDGVFLYVIILCSIIMAWALIKEKNILKLKEEEEFEIIEKD
tara:strand:- start:29376 stop:30617 length:1242 start_codon:yes stop_codon:yes gene_type:complete